MSGISEPVDFIVWGVLTATVLVTEFEAVRRVASAQGGRQSIVVAILAIAISLSAATGNFYFYRLLDTQITAESKVGEKFVELPDSWAKNQSAQDRARNSYFWVAAAYRSTGKLFHHFDCYGNRELFAPTQSHLIDRERVVELNINQRNQADSFLSWGFFWLFIAISVAALGWAIGRSQSSQRANPSINTDAAR